MTIITDATALAWFDQFRVIDGDRLCPEMTLIFADWLEDVHGLDSWAECLRWMVAEGRYPYPIDPYFEESAAYFWTGMVGEEMSYYGEDLIPQWLAVAIGIEPGFDCCTIDFPTPQAAILAVMKVWHQRGDK